MTYVWFILAFIALTTAIAFITHFVSVYKQRQEIDVLWENQETLEKFVRPQQNYTYLFDTYAKDDIAYVDDKTASDINLDDLFKQMNFCFSALGEMRLYAALRGMFTIKHRALIQSFQSDVPFRIAVSRILAGLGKRVYPTFPDQQTKPRISAWPIILTLLPFLTLGILFFSISWGIIITLIVLISNSLISMRMNKIVNDHMKDMTYSLNIINVAKKLHDVKGTPYPSNIDFSLFKTSKYWNSFLGSNANSLNESQMFIEAFKQVFFLDYTLFYFVQRTLRVHEASLLACYDYVADIDAHYALSLWQETQDVITDVSHVENGLYCEALSHPLITDPVRNDFNFDRHILLTGSNASGKSSFMKALALNIVIAEMSDVALADTFAYKPGVVRSSMANQDDVLSGDSYFIAEIKSIKRIVSMHPHRQVYCFIDEIFKGTNTRERVAASTALLTYLAESSNFQIMAATHDIELTETLAKNYTNYHFNEVIQDNEIHFDYKIKAGPADTSNAIELLRIYNFPSAIYNEAKTHAEK